MASSKNTTGIVLYGRKRSACVPIRGRKPRGRCEMTMPKGWKTPSSHAKREKPVEVGGGQKKNISERENVTDNDKFIYEQVNLRYDFELTRSTNLDNKSSNLVGWIGLIISILALGSGILFEANTPLKISLHQLALLVSVFVLLLGSLFFSLVAYRVKSYELVPNPPTSFIKLYKEQSHKLTLVDVTNTKAHSTDKNIGQNDSNFHKVSVGIIFGWNDCDFNINIYYNEHIISVTEGNPISFGGKLDPKSMMLISICGDTVM